MTKELSPWQQWLQHPERSSLRNALFQIHFWTGALIAPWVALMSVSGAVLVYRNELPGWSFLNRLAEFHGNLLAGDAGAAVNGMGAAGIMLLCITGAVIWWPGISHWRRALKVNWRAGFPRVNWDLHSALGFWFLLFVLLWGVSAMTFAFPGMFDALRVPGGALDWLSKLHFGRFNRFTEALWAIVGLVPAALAFTGAFICCRRVIFHKPSNPYR